MVFLFGLFVFSLADAQICKLVEKIPADSNRISLMNHAYPPNERMEVLKTLIAPDSIRYFLTYAHLPEEEKDVYFPLDTAGVYLLDLNMDGKLDIIYSARSGTLVAKSTSIYLNNNDVVAKDTVISGGLIDIYPSKKGCSIYTLWKPCCDSYTNRLENYIISSVGTQFVESISYIGRSKLRHVPNFNIISEKKKIKKGTPFYTMKLDFRNIHPYFREDNKVFSDVLKKDEPLMLLQCGMKVEAIVLGSIDHKGETYYAILTNEMKNVPKSHFEWSAGNHRRFVAWVKAEDL